VEDYICAIVDGDENDDWHGDRIITKKYGLESMMRERHATYDRMQRKTKAR